MVNTTNCYEDVRRAEAYAKLEFPGTYHLAYRDLPELIHRHVGGSKAVDFGCGTGRSTRFLRQLGFDVIGVDISTEMIKQARQLDPQGDYRLIGEDGFGTLGDQAWDLVLSAFTFDNIPGRDSKRRILRGLAGLLKPEGKLVNLVSAPEIYVHEWASFSTRDFPENRRARCGDRVRIVVTDIEDARPVEDVLWLDPDYRAVFAEAGLEVVAVHKPLGREDEPYPWVNETRIAPWVIYVLRKAVPAEAR
jgi:SAM-dependent methyltransferase